MGKKGGHGFKNDNEALGGRLVGVDGLQEAMGILAPSHRPLSYDSGTSLRGGCLKAIFIGHGVLEDFNHLEQKTGFQADQNEYIQHGVTYDSKWGADHNTLAGGIKLKSSLSAAVWQFVDARSTRLMRGSHHSIKKPSLVYKEAHNGGMDSVYNLKSAVGQACHPDFLQCDSFENPLEGIDLNKPLPFLNENQILICMDIEHRELDPKDLTEVGWSWFFLKDVKDVPPGHGGMWLRLLINKFSSTNLALIGRNWFQYVRGTHLRIQEHLSYRVSLFIVGDPLSWDSQYGPQVILKLQDVKEHCERLFRELAQGLHGAPQVLPRSYDGGSPEGAAVSDTVNQAEIVEEVKSAKDILTDEDDYETMLRFVCPNNLRGGKCRVKNDPKHAVEVLHICLDFERGVRISFVICMCLYLSYTDMSSQHLS